MRRTYTGLKAEKVDFGRFDIATRGSLPSGCIQIVADVVAPGGNVCENPPDTTHYMYIGKDPYGSQTYDPTLAC